MTRKEREKQKYLRELAKWEKERGNNKVRVGYKKIFFNRKWHW